MAGRCLLCREGIDDGVYCDCGSRLHPDCYDGHREWCARSGEERWVGTQEF